MNGEIRQQAIRFEWEKGEPLHAALCLPAVVLPLVIGTHYGYPGTAVLMAGGAMTVGFGSFQKPLIWRWGPMLAASLGIALSGAVGVLSGDHHLIFGALVVLWSFLYGLSNAQSPSAAWVGQQCCVYLVVSAAAPSTLGRPSSVWEQAYLRGAGLLAGGLIQMLVVIVLWKLVPRSMSTLSDPDFTIHKLAPRVLWEQIRERTIWFQYALRLAVTGMCAVIAFHFARFNNAYWITMTALLIPKPEFIDTTVRAILRISGTMMGGVLATLLVVGVHPRGEMLAVLVAVFLYGSYCLVNVNYGAFAISLTGYIVFILAIVRQPTSATVTHRVIATFIGGVIGLVVHAGFRLVRGKPIEVKAVTA